MEAILWAAVVVLGIAFAVSEIRLLIIRRELRNIADELRRNRDFDYNRYITVTLVDKGLTELANTLNEELKFQHQLKEGNERAERQLRQSVSDIAHDLRTPLTVIKGNLQLLELEEHSRQSSEYIRICTERTDRLKKIADDFFELSLLESDQTVPIREQIDAGNFLMQFIADNEAVIRENELIPDIRLPERNIKLMGDPKLIERVLENLLNNVLKYAKESFVIELKEIDDICRITFANKAPELTQEDADRLFERTFRASRSRSGNGNGLGLYIVKLLMEKQGGSVSAVLENGVLSINADIPIN